MAIPVAFGNDFNSAMAALMAGQAQRDARSASIADRLGRNSARFMEMQRDREDRAAEAEQNSLQRALAEREIEANTQLGRERNALLGKQISAESDARAAESDRQRKVRQNIFNSLNETALVSKDTYAALKKDETAMSGAVSELESRIEATVKNRPDRKSDPTGHQKSLDEEKILKTQLAKARSDLKTIQERAQEHSPAMLRALGAREGFRYDQNTGQFIDPTGELTWNPPTRSTPGSTTSRSEAGGAASQPPTPSASLNSQRPFSASQFAEEDALYAGPNASNPFPTSGNETLGPERDSRSAIRAGVEDFTVPQWARDLGRTAGTPFEMFGRGLGKFFWDQNIEISPQSLQDAASRTQERAGRPRAAFMDAARKYQDDCSERPEYIPIRFANPTMLKELGVRVDDDDLLDVPWLFAPLAGFLPQTNSLMSH